MDVFFYEAFEEEEAALKNCLPSEMSASFTWKTIQEDNSTEPPASIISIRTQSNIPINWAPKLTAILARSTGFDHLQKYLSESGRAVQCGYLPLYCNRAVAEQAMLLWMALLRKLPRQMKQFSDFARNRLTGQECAGKTLLVVGVGNIGYEVIKIGRGLDMEVLGIDIIQKHPAVSCVSIEEGLSLADIIVCAMNLTNENINYFNYEVLKEAKRGAIFVNIARGELSPSSDLLRLLDEGHLGGIGLDVYDRENELAVSLRNKQPGTDYQVKAALELAKRENVILTPHNAFNTLESVDRKARQSIEQINYFLKHGSFIWPIPR
jgi:D-lactate dehydrogenase